MPLTSTLTLLINSSANTSCLCITINNQPKIFFCFWQIIMMTLAFLNTSPYNFRTRKYLTNSFRLRFRNFNQTNPKKLSRGVSIIGVGCTPFMETLNSPETAGYTEGDLFGYAALSAMEDAGISPKDVEFYYHGEASPLNGSVCVARLHFIIPKPAVPDIWLLMKRSEL